MRHVKQEARKIQEHVVHETSHAREHVGHEAGKTRHHCRGCNLTDSQIFNRTCSYFILDKHEKFMLTDQLNNIKTTSKEVLKQRLKDKRTIR